MYVNGYYLSWILIDGVHMGEDGYAHGLQAGCIHVFVCQFFLATELCCSRKCLLRLVCSAVSRLPSPVNLNTVDNLLFKQTSTALIY